MFDRLVGDWISGMNLLDRSFGTFGGFMPEVDVTETSKEIRLTADLPGMDEENLEVSYLDGAIITLPEPVKSADMKLDRKDHEVIITIAKAKTT